MGDKEFDAEQLKEMFKVIEEKVPGLLDKLTKVLYGTEEAERYGKAVAIFYKSLVEAGMSNEQAFQLTKDYMSNLAIGKMIGGMRGAEGKSEE